MNVINITSLDSNGTLTFNYTFKLNTGEDVDNSLLPHLLQKFTLTWLMILLAVLMVNMIESLMLLSNK